MRTLKLAAVMAVSVALVLVSVPAAFALRGGGGDISTGGGHRPRSAPYRISKPSVASGPVVAGVAFDASGTLVPPIAADDTTTVIGIEVFGVNQHGRLLQADFTTATVSAIDTDTSGYDASLSIGSPGTYALVAVVTNGGRVVARSAVTPVRVVPPYRVSRPRFSARPADVGVSFDATGVIGPAIDPTDPSLAVGVEVFSFDRRGRPVLSTFTTATISSIGTDTSGYDASLSVGAAGEYGVAAVVERDGVVVAQSAMSTIRVVLPYRVSRPFVDQRPVVAGSSFTATVVVSPAPPSGDPSYVLTVYAYQVGRRGRLSEVTSATAGAAGPISNGTAYTAALTLPTRGLYELVAVLTQGDTVVGRSAASELRVRASAPPVTGGSGGTVGSQGLSNGARSRG